ncbi:MAG TPA: S8 family serine peptidase [Candidatus Elarobacter sp.]|nr:S8 family serine peptidase [Candidatus Elarobacter sp.]
MMTTVTLAACGMSGGAVPPTSGYRDTSTLKAVPIDPSPTPAPSSGGGGLLGGLLGLVGGVLSIVGDLGCGLTGLTCHVVQGTGPQGQPAGTPASELAGYHPADLQSAYALPSSTAGAGQTIGIAVANDDPNLESDLGVYRTTFGLAPCTTANGCFKKIKSGSVSPDQGWGQEASIDVQMASAVCPQCKIVVVEASAATDTALLAAAKTAVANGATVVSDSYSVVESSTEDDAAYAIGVPFVFGAGDSGFGAEWPAASSHVIAVGGTSLARARNARGWSETVWSGSGGGCSKYVAKPAWQHDAACAHRTANDISAYADPNPGVAVFDTYLKTNPGWRTYGGTSVAAPIVAGAIALAGNGKTDLLDASYIYAHANTLNPVTAGSTGSCGTYLCMGTAGYSGPAGNGSLNGLGAL